MTTSYIDVAAWGVGFIAVGALAVACAALERVRRRYYPSPRPRPYAVFEPGPARFGPAPPGPHVHLVEVFHCLGPCTGRRPHETAGDGTATCVQCGTLRPTTDTTDKDQPHAS